MTYSDITHGLWAETAKGKPELKMFSGEHRTEVAVIGGGYTGLSAALHLAKEGHDTVLLEANAVGFGGAGRNVGLVNAGLWLMPEDVISLVGEDHGEKLIDVLGASPDLVYGLIDEYDIPCEPWRFGTLHCADSGSGYKALKERERQWQKRGAPVELLEKEEAAQKLGTQVFRGALLDKRAGTVQPLGYAFGLAQAALKEGASLFENTPVTALNKKDGEFVLETPEGRLLAKKVIVAVMGYPEQVFDNHMKNMVPFNYFQFATPPLSRSILETVLPGRNGAWDTNLILSSYRLDEAGRLIVGSVGKVEGFAWDLKLAWAKRTIAKVFPQVGQVDMEHGWYGRIAMTTDHIPRFHVMDKDMAMVTCYNGRGIGPGTVFGKLLARYMTEGSRADIPLPISPIQAVNFRRLRGLFYEAGSRLYHFAQRRI
ncbi:MAG TPA: FAD-dependent oxidoreductase [Desulfobacteraceae bacterium]|nr:FAD-dependent oxidoreductase [Desulfobacteraceae bacterium]